MTGVISHRARALAAQLEREFARDAELAKGLCDAQERLAHANDRLWWGIHPDGLVAVYDEDPAVVEVAFAENRSELLGAADPRRRATGALEHPQCLCVLPGRRQGTPASCRRHRRDDPPTRRRARGDWLEQGAGKRRERPRARNYKPTTRRNQVWERR